MLRREVGVQRSALRQSQIDEVLEVSSEAVRQEAENSILVNNLRDRLSGCCSALPIEFGGSVAQNR